MSVTPEFIIQIAAAVITLLLLIFAVDWRYFRDWVVVFLFKSLLDITIDAALVKANLLIYPVRLLARFYDISLLFDFWVFPVLCVLYNQVTRERSLWPIIYYAALFSVGMTLIEYFLELYTGLIEYINWSWYVTFIGLTLTFLASRLFIAFFRWGCRYFGRLGSF